MSVQRYYTVKSPLAKTDTFERLTRARFPTVSINNGLWTPLKAAVVYIQDRGFNSFPANTLKITVDKIKCTDSLGRTHAFKVPGEAGGRGGGGGGKETDWKEASLPLCYKALMPSPSEHMKPRWRPVKTSTWSPRSYGKKGDFRQSITHINLPQLTM